MYSRWAQLGFIAIDKETLDLITLLCIYSSYLDLKYTSSTKLVQSKEICQGAKLFLLQFLNKET